MEPGLVVLGVRERVVGEEVGQRHVPPLVAHLHDDLVGKLLGHDLVSVGEGDAERDPLMLGTG